MMAETLRALRNGVIVLAPHPDDETLGCGGLIAVATGRPVPLRVVFLTDGAASHPGGNGVARLRRREAIAAVARLGGRRRHVVFGGFADGALGKHIADAAGLLRRVASSLPGALVIAPAATDEHPDHRAAHRLAKLLVARSRRGLLTYRVWGRQSERECRVRVPALRHVPRVRAALSRHASQLGRAPSGFGRGFVLPKAVADMARRPMVALAAAT